MTVRYSTRNTWGSEERYIVKGSREESKREKERVTEKKTEQVRGRTREGREEKRKKERVAEGRNSQGLQGSCVTFTGIKSLNCTPPS